MEYRIGMLLLPRGVVEPKASAQANDQKNKFPAFLGPCTFHILRCSVEWIATAATVTGRRPNCVVQVRFGLRHLHPSTSITSLQHMFGNQPDAIKWGYNFFCNKKKLHAKMLAWNPVSTLCFLHFLTLQIHSNVG